MSNALPRKELVEFKIPGLTPPRSLIQPIRAFVALPLPPDWSEPLMDIQRALQQRLPSPMVRWTRPEQMHLTLRFLGYLPPEQVPGLEDALGQVGRQINAFRLVAGILGGFPHLQNPRVLWLGLAGDLEALNSLQAQVLQASQPWGDHVEERPFHPHLTLGRVNAASAEEKRRLAERLADVLLPEFSFWQAQRIELVQSDLQSAGARYTVLTAIPLSG
jgi:RNA 2',3'-cyclic 3'-phosphodiesterase